MAPNTKMQDHVSGRTKRENGTTFFIRDSKVIAMIDAQLTAVASQAAEANSASVWHLESEELM